jgi:cell division protein FtsQ
MTTRTKITRKGGKARPPQKRKGPPKKGWFAKLIEALPVSEAFVSRAVTVSTIALVGAGVLGLAWFSGAPGYVGTELAQAAGRAGFTVKRVEITGIDRMEQMKVYGIALDQHSRAMPLVDLEKVREELLQFGWVEDARVSRRLPDTLVVDIVERTPVAVWQNNQKLALIDAKGVILEPIDPAAMPDLPMLIGPDANREALALNKLMERSPSLKPALQSATWVGDRRWDLRFNSGEILMLPEGEPAAEKAIATFARIDGVQRLLGRGHVRFDMRNADRLVVKKRQKPSVAAAEEASANADEKKSKDVAKDAPKSQTAKSQTGGQV